MKTNCNKCIHAEMCKFKDTDASAVLATVQEDFPFIGEIDFACKFFQKKERAEKNADKVADKTADESAEEKAEPKAEKAEAKTEAKSEAKPVEDKKADKADDKAEKTESFEGIKVKDFGFKDAAMQEILAVAERDDVVIGDLKALAPKLSDLCKKMVNERLQAFNYSI